jgi:hypothetical protein
MSAIKLGIDYFVSKFSDGAPLKVAMSTFKAA